MVGWGSSVRFRRIHGNVRLRLRALLLLLHALALLAAAGMSLGRQACVRLAVGCFGAAGLPFVRWLLQALALVVDGRWHVSPRQAASYGLAFGLGSVVLAANGVPAWRM